MISLAIDTTSVCASCAVLQDTNLLAESFLHGGLSHSETMLCMIDQMLENLSIKTKEIDLFALTTGPGSFTGVRIGVSLVKGLAFGTGKPCVGVSTLDALAAQCLGTNNNSFIVPVMDARRAQVYTALYHPTHIRCSLDEYLDTTYAEMQENTTLLSPNDVLGKCSPEQAISISKLEEQIRASSLVPLFVGDGCDAVKQNTILSNVTYAPKAIRFQRAYDIGLCALLQYRYALSLGKQNLYTDLLLKPVYLRQSQAERQRAKQANIQLKNHEQS